ncbi:hypothetical protein FRB96_005897 [Tulasnella sp. 330]|nr:hypothetical protein FRB96_005897 [Tulasnella sp. 330]
MHPKYYDELVDLAYYDELVDLAVEDVTYRVSKSLFSQSAPFSKVFCSHPGGQPISLIGATVSEMESLLDVLHARQTEAPLELKIEEWGGALHLATKWGFGTVREHIIKHIEHHSTDQEAVDRFELAMKCHVPQWLHPAYNTLCTRGQHITADEGRRLGYERLTAICRIREIFRLEPGKVDVNGRCGECDTCHSSGIRKHNVFGTFYFEELQCMSPPKVANANALQWISEDEHLKTSFSEVEEDITIAISVAHPNPPASAASDTEVSKRRASEIECLAPVTCVDRKPSDGPSNMVIVPEANNGSYYLANPSNHANVQPHTRILIIDPKVTNAGDTPPPVEPNAPAKKAKAKKAERKCPAHAESRNKVGTESETHVIRVPDAMEECKVTASIAPPSEPETILVTAKSDIPVRSDIVPRPGRMIEEGSAAAPSNLQVTKEVTAEFVVSAAASANIEGCHASARSSAVGSRAISGAQVIPGASSKFALTGYKSEKFQGKTKSEIVKEEFLLIILWASLYRPSSMHHKYNDELVNLAVEDVTYRVCKSLLSQSAPFSEVIRLHRGDQPISLVGVTPSEMERLLDVLHARQTEAPLQLKIEEWGSALHLATKWGFVTAREHIIKHIELHSGEQEALDRFELAMKCHVPQWLHPAYATLCTRSKHITANEGKRLGYERLTAICRIREILRSQTRKVEADGHCGECDTCRSNNFYAHKRRPDSWKTSSCISPQNLTNVNALQWISEAEHLKASFPEVEEDVAIAIPITHLNSTASAAPNIEGSTARAFWINNPALVTNDDGKLKKTPSNMASGLDTVNGPPNLVNKATHEKDKMNPKPKKKKKCLTCAETGLCGCRIVALFLGRDAKADYQASELDMGEPKGIVPATPVSELEGILVTGAKSDATARLSVVANPGEMKNEGPPATDNEKLGHIEAIKGTITGSVVGVEAAVDIEDCPAPAESSALSVKSITAVEAEREISSKSTLKDIPEAFVQAGASSKEIKEEFLLVGQDPEGSDSGWSL